MYSLRTEQNLYLFDTDRVAIKSRSNYAAPREKFLVAIEYLALTAVKTSTSPFLARKADPKEA
jgi:hypothetical protein